MKTTLQDTEKSKELFAQEREKAQEKSLPVEKKVAQEVPKELLVEGIGNVPEKAGSLPGIEQAAVQES